MYVSWPKKVILIAKKIDKFQSERWILDLDDQGLYVGEVCKKEIRQDHDLLPELLRLL